jgi:hypothetical protein
MHYTTTIDTRRPTPRTRLLVKWRFCNRNRKLAQGLKYKSSPPPQLLYAPGAASDYRSMSAIGMLQQLWVLALNSKSDVTHVIDITRSFVWP